MTAASDPSAKKAARQLNVARLFVMFIMAGFTRRSLLE
ncbi:hypothetical protein Mal52_39470 [Symmachiella dynata]|uniref:Uncharacterized protein n=1 Tax=Symmachiella dynata TaxID=2527995 RepID=A0A517ZSM3_9PLAN|nr:hypothetical protein Mal52_39470 [Symmachiella dynata]